LGDVWIRTQRAAVASRYATQNIAIALTQWGDGGGAGGEGGQGGGEGGGHGRLRQQLVRYRRPAQWTSPLNLHISFPKTKLVKRDSSVRCFFRSSRIERKYLKFFHVVPIFTELGQDLTHLAHKENMQSNIFLWDRLKILIAFCSLRALI
jgi:hypothetical protein